MKKVPFLFVMLILCFCPGLIAGQADQVKVKVGVAVVRVKPDTASAVLLQVNQGMVLDVVRKAGDWYEVKIQKGPGTVVSGFIRNDLVDPVIPAPKPAPRPATEIKPVSPPPPPSPAERLRQRWGFRLGGGWSRVSLADINAKRTGDTDFWRDVAAQYNQTFSGAFQNFHGSLDLEGAVTFDVTPGLSLSLGAGFIQARASKEIGTVVSATSYGLVARVFEERAQAIPVKLGVRYSMRFGSRLEGYVRAEAGYYFVQWTEDNNFTVSGTLDVTEQITAHGSGAGLDGGVGLEFKVTPTLSLFLEGLGRYAKVGGLKADYDYRNISGNYTDHDTGTLYYCEWYSPDRKNWYPGLGVYTAVPASEGARNAREARLDFSGFSIRAGLSLKLF